MDGDNRRRRPGADRSSKPKLGETSLSVAAGYGNYNALDFEGAANVAVGDDAAVRLAGKVVHRDGYNQDGTSDEIGQAVRGQILVKPMPTLTLRLAVDWSH